MDVSRIAVLGCGLIGGSVAMSARRRWPDVEIFGLDRPRVVQRALSRRVVDHAIRWREIARWEGDMIVIALPVPQVLAALERLSKAASAPRLMDVASVKEPVHQRAAACGIQRFVGGHPMAGYERGGLARADAALFDGRAFCLCPGPATARSDVAWAQRFVRGLGARAVVIDARVHDQCVALMSHVPHLAAWGLMHAARALEQGLPKSAPNDLPFRLGGGSWRDATRVAQASPQLWGPIVEHNREAIGEALDLLLEALKGVREDLRRPGSDVLGRLDATTLARLRGRTGRYLA